MTTTSRMIEALETEKVNADDTLDPTDIAYNTAVDHCIQAIHRIASEEPTEPEIAAIVTAIRLAPFPTVARGERNQAKAAYKVIAGGV